MAPEARYDSDNADPAPLGKPLDFAFSGKSAQNRLYIVLPPNEHDKSTFNNGIVSKLQ